ncbi:MAG: IS3 family transposase, partial [Deltaproteobacteria bacterium]|nr:IS3 family transposase [Deltaproteobacteria bacterium]
MVREMIKSGGPIKVACESFDVHRSSWYYKNGVPIITTTTKMRGEIDMRLVGEIKLIVGQHPFWGYRRVHAYLKHRKKINVGKKRIKRLMKEEGLLARQKRFKPERPLRDKPQADGPNQFWGTDMTKFMVPSFGWVYLVIVIDWYTK